MAMTLEGLLAAADAWWSTPEAVSTASAIGGVGLIRWRHEAGVSPPMDVPFQTLRYRLAGYRSRRVTRGGLHDFSGPRGAVSIIAEGPQGTWEYLDDVDCVELYVTGEHIERLAEREGIGRVAVREQPSVNDPLLVSLTAELAGLTLIGERESLYVETLVNAVLLRIARAHSERPKAEFERRHDLAPWKRRRTEEYLQAHFASDLSLSELAAEADMPPFLFARAFQRSTGFSPFGFQRRVRMERARALLSGTDLPIDEVARRVGYMNTRAFTEIFTAEVGVSPLLWRLKATPDR